MKIYQKIVLISSVILLAAGCGATQPQVSNQPPVASAVQPTTTPSGQTQTKDNPNGQDYFPNGQHPEDPAEITIQQTVEGSNLNNLQDKVAQGMNALAALKLYHKVDTKNYSGIGEFVESIDGIAPDSKHFWAFYVNGKPSNIGASSYVLKNGDKIEWKLEAIN